MRTLTIIATWSARVLAVAAAIVILALVTLLIAVPRITHTTTLTVLTGSMSPAIPTGSVVFEKPVDPNTLRVGQVATYQKRAGQAEYITHRIVAIDRSTQPAMLTFQGDANNAPDLNRVPVTAVRGVVWFHIAYLGTAERYVHSTGTHSLVLAALIAGLAGYAAWQLGSGLNATRHAHRAAHSRSRT